MNEMVAISFSVPELLPKLIDGSKRQTIRKHNPKRIEQMKRLGLQIYWKLRYKDGYKLHDGIYTEGFQLLFQSTEGGISDKYKYLYRINTDAVWELLTPHDAEDIARRDGFDSWLILVGWLEGAYGDLHNQIFDGIRWMDVKP
jgi:hypothetical protein